MKLRILAIAVAMCAVGSQAAAAPIVLNVSNGHYYEAIAPAFTWNAAQVSASSVSYLGLTGHLATISSQSENDFIRDTFPAAMGTSTSFGYWIGLYRNDDIGTYQWVTGEAYAFTSWNVGEPNGDPAPVGVHFFGQGYTPGLWNDASVNYGFGYVVEYEAAPGTAAVPEPASLLLLGTGLFAAVAARRRFSKRT